MEQCSERSRIVFSVTHRNVKPKCRWMSQGNEDPAMIRSHVAGEFSPPTNETFSFAFASALALALIVKPIDRLCLIGHLKLVVDLVDMLFDGACGDAKQISDFFIEQSFG